MVEQNNRENNSNKSQKKENKVTRPITKTLDTILSIVITIRNEIDKNRKLAAIIAIPVTIMLIIGYYLDLRELASSFKDSIPYYVPDTYFSFNSGRNSNLGTESHLYLGLSTGGSGQKIRGKVWLFAEDDNGGIYKVLTSSVLTISHITGMKHEKSFMRRIGEVPNYLLTCIKAKGEEGKFRKVFLVNNPERTRSYETDYNNDIVSGQILYTIPSKEDVPEIELFKRKQCDSLIEETGSEDGRLFYKEKVTAAEQTLKDLFAIYGFRLRSAYYKQSGDTLSWKIRLDFEKDLTEAVMAILQGVIVECSLDGRNYFPTSVDADPVSNYVAYHLKVEEISANKALYIRMSKPPSGPIETIKLPVDLGKAGHKRSW